ncbi:MAG: phosphotransferase [Actinomycetota bacterium]
MESGSDPRLGAAIRAVGAWHGRDIGITPVSIGHDERHFMVEVDDELFVLRLTGPGPDDGRADPDVEVEVTRAAAAAGVASEVIAFLPQLRCLITRFAPGRRPSTADGANHETLISIVGSMRALHACPLPGRDRSVFREAEEVHHVALMRGVRMPETEAAATEAMRRIEDACAEPSAPVTCHGDLSASSIFLDGAHVTIVDYRWAGAGDAFEDLGSVARCLGLSDESTDELLDLYHGSADEGRRARLDLMRLATGYLAAMRSLARRDDEERSDAGHALALVAEMPADVVADRHP